MSKNKHTINRKGNEGVINIPGCDSYSFSIGASTSDNWTELLSGSADISWESDSQHVGGKEIVPYGTNNDLPTEIRNIMDDNNLAPGILEREVGLLWGQGPRLFTEEYTEDGDISRVWVKDEEIENWLKGWAYERYLRQSMVEYKYLKGFFTKVYRNKGPRIGRSAKIAKLECVPGVDARLGWVDTRRLEDVKNIYTGDFENHCSNGIKTFPVFDVYDPFKYAVAMQYSNMYSFARNFYSVPGYYGSLNWIKRSSDIPQILKSLTDNSLNIKWHIISPQIYWDEKEDRLRKQAELKGVEYKDSMLDELKDDVFNKLADVMAGKTNVGKFFTSVSFKDDEGDLQKWEIVPIDQKVKDFIEAQIEISKKADSATTSGIGLHPSLSNIMIDGKLSSGSEMLYALKLYLASDTNIPESVVTEPINFAIKTNFPDKEMKLGFYHKIVLREENVSPEQRTTNNI